MNKSLRKKLTFYLRTYDVWGNARDGFEVNDVWAKGYVTLTVRLKVVTQPDGTIHEYYDLTDRAINRTLGFRGVTWESTEHVDSPHCILYGENKRNGKPFGELKARHDA